MSTPPPCAASYPKICAVSKQRTHATDTSAASCLRILFTILVIVFVADSPAYSQFTPADPPAMAPAEFAPDYVEETWKWSIRTDTIPGYLYSVEESTDLATWTLVPNSYFYGNGTQLKCFICDGPPPPGQNTAGNGNGNGSNAWPWQVHHFSLTLRMQAGITATSYFLQRETSDPLSPNAWQTNLTEPLPPQVEGNRYFSMLEWADPTTHLLYWVDVRVIIIIAAAPPTADPAQAPGIEDETDLTIYENIKPQLIARLLTSPSTSPTTTTPSNSKYARIRRTAIDSNGNGYPDWYEYANFGPDSVFALESSEDYVDGSLDSDGDGFTNAEEIAGKTDPNSAASHPPETTYLAVATKSISFGGVIFGSMWGLPSSLRHTITKENSWQPPFTKTTLGAGYSSATAMEADLLGPAFPDSPDKMPLEAEKEKTLPELITIDGGYTKHTTSPLAASGSATKTKFWLVHKPISTQAVTRHYILSVTKTPQPASFSPANDPTILTFTVAPDHAYSEPQEFTAFPSEVTPATGDTTEAVTISKKFELLQIKAWDTADSPREVTNKKQLGITQRIQFKVSPEDFANNPANGPITWQKISGIGAFDGAPPSTSYAFYDMPQEKSDLETVGATIMGVALDRSYEVIEPTGLGFKKVIAQTGGYDPGTQGAGMILQAQVLPTDVWFQFVHIREKKGAATNPLGYFLDWGAEDLIHKPNPNWSQLDDDNSFEDEASFNSWPNLPWAPGSFEWDIPYYWTPEAGRDDLAKEFPEKVKQINVIDDNLGTSHTTKFGHDSEKQTP